MIYNTTYQLLTRVKNITYLRANWGIAGLFGPKKKRKEKEVKIRLFI
jgi:hypothetical protein